jgi:hypothetical protein
MKIHRNAIINIIFLMAILCCFSTHAYSSCNFNPDKVEFSTNNESAGSIYVPDTDPLNDDQIIRSADCGSWTEPGYLLTLPQNCPAIVNFYLSVWHPPEIS